MALSIFRGALTSSQAIGNMQWRNEAISAANETIDLLLSEARVATDTANRHRSRSTRRRSGTTSTATTPPM